MRASSETSASATFFSRDASESDCLSSSTGVGSTASVMVVESAGGRTLAAGGNADESGFIRRFGRRYALHFDRASMEAFRQEACCSHRPVCSVKPVLGEVSVSTLSKFRRFAASARYKGGRRHRRWQRLGRVAHGPSDGALSSRDTRPGCGAEFAYLDNAVSGHIRDIPM